MADVRITSAGAESTPSSLTNSAVCWDHLCGCREYSFPIVVVAAFSGSPLRVQRVQAVEIFFCSLLRITSAGAESTLKNRRKMPSVAGSPLRVQRVQ